MVKVLSIIFSSTYFSNFLCIIHIFAGRESIMTCIKVEVS